MAAYVHDTAFFTRRSAVLFTIIALHVFIGWALATGLARKAIEVLAPPIQTDIVQEEKNKAEPPPPPPDLQKQVVEVPPPDVTIELPVETTQTTAISNVTTKHVEAAPPAAKPANKVPPKGKFGPTDGYYPEASRRPEACSRCRGLSPTEWRPRCTRQAGARARARRDSRIPLCRPAVQRP